jgi:putative hydrolase of the HAD superfamily
LKSVVDDGALLALDVDGVLLDPERGGRGPWQVAFAERFGVDAGLLDESLFATSWADVITGQRPVESALSEALHDLGWDVDVEAALQCWFEEDFVLNPVVLAEATLWSGRGVPLVLASNQEPRRGRYLQERLAQVLPIRGVAFSGDLGAVKKDPDFYDRAERHLGIVGRGRSVILVDDTPGNLDVAVQHGWTGIHFTGGTDWQGQIAAALERALPDHPAN